MVMLRWSTSPLMVVGAVVALSGPLKAAPVSVGLISGFQSELGCVSDFDPSCPASQLAAPSFDSVWRETFSILTGDWTYKAALDGDFSQNYGEDAALGGPDVGLSLSADRDVRFYYDEVTHWVTDNVNSVIATLAGSFQSELGCASDFNASCMESWLKDIDGDGIYEFSAILPTGSYSTVVAHDEAFDEIYGVNGTLFGGNIDFTVPDEGLTTVFRYSAATHLLTIQVGDDPGPSPVPLPASALLLGGALAGLRVLRRSGSKWHRFSMHS